VYLSSHPITVNGLRLDTLAWGIESSAMRLGGLRSADAVLAGLDGYVASLDDAREPSSLGLAMFLRGTDEDGSVPAGQDAYQTLRYNLDTILHAMGQSGGLIDVREAVGPSWAADPVLGLTGADVRQFYGKVRDALEPNLEQGSSARLTVVIENPGVYWRPLDTADWSQAGPVSGTTYEVTTLQGTSGPVDDAVILLAGPTTGAATITDTATGAFVRLNEAIPAGSAWRINVATWESRVGAGLTLGSADTTGTDKSAVTDQGGGYPRLLRLNPRRSGGARKVNLKVEATGMTGATTLSVRARKTLL
jgi:hypothetical protein